MPQYEMPINSADARKRFAELDEFTQGYIECALWVGIDTEDEDHFGGVDKAAFDDLAPEALASMIEDARDFQASNGADLEEWGDDYQAGNDFWLTRNGHGAGFWDRGRGELGDRLTAMAKPYGGIDLYVGDDGRLYAT